MEKNFKARVLTLLLSVSTAKGDVNCFTSYQGMQEHSFTSMLMFSKVCVAGDRRKGLKDMQAFKNV